MEHYKKILNFRTSAGAAHHIITKFGKKWVNWGKFGAIGANLEGIGALETKVTKYGIIRSDRPSGGAAPLRKAERSLNTNPLGSWGSIDDVLAAPRRLGPEKMLKNGQKWAFARQEMAKNGQKWVFSQQRSLNCAPKGPLW